MTELSHIFNYKLKENGKVREGTIYLPKNDMSWALQIIQEDHPEAMVLRIAKL